MYKEPISVYQREVESFKKVLLRKALEAHGGNRTNTARTLGLQRTYLARLIKDFGIKVPIPERIRREHINGE